MIATHSATLTPLGDLKGADYNPRAMPKKEMSKLINSLREFGFVEPVVARKEDGLIIGGHQRVAALRQMLADGKTDEAAISAYKVPVVFVNVTDDKAKLLNLALNKISGDWDYEKLHGVIESLTNLDEVELSGFTMPELEDLATLMGAQEDSLEVQDIDEELAKEARRLIFKLDSPEDLALVTHALKAHGMTGPKDAATALVNLARTVQGFNA